MRRRFRKPAGFPFWRTFGVVVAAAVGGMTAFFCWPNDGVVDAEAKYDGVHLCSPSQQAAATGQVTLEATQPPGATSPLTPSTTQAPPTGTLPATAGGAGQAGGATAATVAPPATPTPDYLLELGGDGSTPHFFSQTSSIWGSDVYAHGDQQDIGCGSTIKQCGCAMTSVTTVLSMFQVVALADGRELSPQTLNDWFDSGAVQTADGGWVSKGYAYGNVVWTAVNAFSAEVSSARAGTPRVGFAGWGPGEDGEIAAEINAGRPVVLEVPGHFIAGVAVQDGQILINDPYYRDRTLLSAYEGRVLSSRHFEAQDNLSAITVVVPSNLRIRITDSQGNTTGTLAGGDPAKVASGATEEIPGSAYRYEDAWRDPTCTERPPPPGSGTNTIVINDPPPNEPIQLEVVNPDGGGTTVAIYDNAPDGSSTFEVKDSPDDHQTLRLEPQGDISEVKGVTVTPGPSATPDETTTVTPTAKQGKGTATSTPLPRGTEVVATVTRGPQPPTSTSTPLPPSPTATRPPGPPALEIGSLNLGVGFSGTVQLMAVDIPSPGLGAWTIDIVYDPAIAAIPTCSRCNPTFSADAVRVTGAAGAPAPQGTFSLAELTVRCDAAGSSALSIQAHVLSDGTPGSPQPMSVTISNGLITCT